MVVFSPAVLLVGTDPHIIGLLESVRTVVSGFRYEVCPDSSHVPRLLQQDEVVLVLMHVTSDKDPAEVKDLLRSVAHTERPVVTVLLTEECDEPTKTDYLRAGAAYCLPRDVSLQKLAHTLDALTFRVRDVQPALVEAPKDVEIVPPDPSYYVLSPEMTQLMDQIQRTIPQDTTILFTGETGTGKTRTARLIHEMSPRRNEPFIVVDCNALSPSLIESELFGHVKGAFTGADRDRPGKFSAAGKGTLVLDEINSLSLGLQSKLLRVVDDRVFEPVGSNKSQPLRARLITISNACLKKEAEAGRFRADLYYRLNVVGFYLPPLRDRLSAIGPLAQKFLAQFAPNNRPEKAGITPEALRVLERYHWPGNIRELGNVIERAITLFPGPMVQVSHLPEALRANDIPQLGAFSNLEHLKEPSTIPMPSKGIVVSDSLTLTKTKERAEIGRITEALEKHRNNRLRAAAELGISRMALYKKLHKYGLHSTG